MYHFPFDIAPKASHGTVPSTLQSFNPSIFYFFLFLHISENSFLSAFPQVSGQVVHKEV